ncbi:hypothetical protein L207DRAFT_593376 [Hyaloscypha variabilis F]|uniref:Uncharacterized protein n=1 Tax=Hyaloscypha variabilis (strain UAMH 11265 / GT02V1 / F) TaxID=1149755 RepID=A0A2J6QTI6_HYAVF|nr:hypothetical protein L207DRAFT_593376 [Hyaloscypha variabilis F]
MSKAKPKKSTKPEKQKIKESDENQKNAETAGAGEAKPQVVEERWSDWIWDEEMKLYYRAKPGNGDEWIYDFACPDLHPATKKEIADLIPEKFEFPKGEEKVVFVEPKYKFEVSSGRGNEYGVSVREEARPGPAAGREGGKPAGESAGPKPAVRVEVEAKASGGQEGKQKNLEKSVEDDRGRSAVRKQPEKEGKGKGKDRDKHHERKDSKHKEKKK